MLLRSICLLSCLIVVSPLVAQEPGTGKGFEHAYFLETHTRDLAAAIAEYEKIVNNSSVSDTVREESRQRLADCVEEVIASDLGRLMPPNAVAYVELNQPGKNIGRLVKSLGLLEEPDPSLAGKSIPLDDGIGIPLDLKVSPALLRELSKIRGAACALTSLDFDRDVPPGLLVLNMGDSDLLRGLIETGIQFIRPDGDIEGFSTYSVEGRVWMTATRKLLFVSSSKREISEAIRRMRKVGTRGDSQTSLADTGGLKQFKKERGESLLFAYVGGDPIREIMRREMRGEEALIANVMLDPQSLNHFVATLQVREDEVEFKAALNYKEGHRSLAYGLLQTEPIQGRSLRSIPNDVAGFAAIGMNPFMSGGTAEPHRTSEVFSLLDIGREIFSNVTEIGLFVAVPKEVHAGPPIPDFGVVLSVNDGKKSEALWNQMLSLPAAVGMPEAETQEDVRVGGRRGKRFMFPDVPPMTLLKLDDSNIVFGTDNAVAASIRADEDKIEDARSVLEKLPNANKAVVINVGNAIDLVAALQPADAREIKQVRAVIEDMTVSLITDEQPNELTVRFAGSKLPNLRRVLQQFAKRVGSPSDR